MGIIEWSILGILAIVILFSIKNWFRFILYSFARNGFITTIALIGFTVLFIAPGIIKSYAPYYYGYAIWTLIIYTVIVLVVSYNFRKEDYKEDA